MKVAELLETRRQNWRELEQLCAKLETRRRSRIDAATMVRFSTLYRAACADLALADSYQLPQQTIAYLHHLVARAYNQLYRSRPFNPAGWSRALFEEVPQRLIRDWCLWLAAALFWGFFFTSMALGYIDQDFPLTVVPEVALEQLDGMYAEPIGSTQRRADMSSAAAGFYIQHNTTIGLRCFVMGIVFGVGGMYETLQNAVQLGAMFGYMARGEHWGNFSHFITAHGPFELTAIVLAAAAGMRLGFSLIDTQGWSRKDSILRAAKEAVPAAGMAILLFAMAAFIEGFISPSAPPSWWPITGANELSSWYWAIKFPVAVVSTALLLFYFFVLGLPRPTPTAR